MAVHLRRDDGAGVRRQHLRILNVTQALLVAGLLQRIAGFPQQGRNVDAGERIGAGDDQDIAGLHAGEGLARPQDRQRTFEAAQIEGLFRHRQGSQKSWLILIIRAVVAVKPELEPGISS